MKTLFFDTGPIITLILSRLGWILPKLKEKFGGEFYITPAVKYELVDRPLTTRRFEFEALEVMKLIREGVFVVYDKVPAQDVKRLQNLANTSFKIRGKTMDVLQGGEMESVVCALKLGSSGIVMDERTLRLFIEDNRGMEKLLEHRFRGNVIPNTVKMDAFSKNFSKLTIIRSIELVGVAYKMGLLNSYIPKVKGGKRTLLDGVLWATKYNGCAVTPHEIEELKQELLK